MTPVPPVHASLSATTIVIGDAGIALRGAPGAGKSSLALALVETVSPRRFARLVADDITRVEIAGGRVIARAVPRVAGLIERRGLGIVPVPAASSVVLRLVVDCAGRQPQRLPEPEMLVTTVLGIVLPRIEVEGLPRDVSLILSALELMVADLGEP